MTSWAASSDFSKTEAADQANAPDASRIVRFANEGWLSIPSKAIAAICMQVFSAAFTT